MRAWQDAKCEYSRYGRKKLDSDVQATRGRSGRKNAKQVICLLDTGNGRSKKLVLVIQELRHSGMSTVSASQLDLILDYDWCKLQTSRRHIWNAVSKTYGYPEPGTASYLEKFDRLEGLQLPAKARK